MIPASTSPKKPSPLSWGSPRPSPLKRPESPLMRSPSALRPTTPPISPIKLSLEPIPLPATPRSYGEAPTLSTSDAGYNQAPPPAIRTFAPSPASSKTVTMGNPTLSTPQALQFTGMYEGGGGGRPSPVRTLLNGGAHDAVSKLDPARILEMRDAFQILDRDDDGQVTKDDVIEMLSQLGQDARSGAASAFFPPSSQPTLNLSSYLNTLSNLLAPLSSGSELNAAFAAFDLDDSGQVDLQELREALQSMAPEPGHAALSERDINTVMEGFSGRRAFSKAMSKESGKRGDVFRYTEFIGAIAGGGKPPLDAEGKLAVK